MRCTHESAKKWGNCHRKSAAARRSGSGVLVWCGLVCGGRAWGELVGWRVGWVEWNYVVPRPKPGYVKTYVSSASREQLVAAAQPIMGGTAPTTAPTHVLTSLRVLESV